MDTILEVKSITKSFGGVRAVNACSFAVHEKQITALIGPNGAGKTTLFNVVNGFITADAGEVLFRGTEVTNAPVWQRSRAGLSRTFQLARVFKNLSIRDNLVLALRQDDDRFWTMLATPRSGSRFDAQIQEMLAFVGLEKDINDSVTALSYGEQKLFDLARALLGAHSKTLSESRSSRFSWLSRREEEISSQSYSSDEQHRETGKPAEPSGIGLISAYDGVAPPRSASSTPSSSLLASAGNQPLSRPEEGFGMGSNPHALLLLDEPVAGVNPVIRGNLKEIMLHLKERGETVLLIEHDMDFVRSVADHAIVMDQGGVLAEGEPNVVLNDKRVLEAYLGKANH